MNRHEAPPTKRNTGLIIGLTTAIVVPLGALGIAGFVTPGFFLSDDDSGQHVIEQAVRAVNAGDDTAATALACVDSIWEETARTDIEAAITGGARITIDSTGIDEPNTYQANITVASKDSTANGFIGAIVHNGAWCVSRITIYDGSELADIN